MSAETKNGDEYSDIGGDRASAARDRGRGRGSGRARTRAIVYEARNDGEVVKKSYSTSKLPPLSKTSKTFRGPEDVLLKQSKCGGIGPRQSTSRSLRH